MSDVALRVDIYEHTSIVDARTNAHPLIRTCAGADVACSQASLAVRTGLTHHIGGGGPPRDRGNIAAAKSQEVARLGEASTARVRGIA